MSKTEEGSSDMGLVKTVACLMYPRQVVLQFNSSEANVFQFVNLLFQPVIELLHHHQAFIGSDTVLGRHPRSQEHTRYLKKTEMLQRKYVALLQSSTTCVKLMTPVIRAKVYVSFYSFEVNKLLKLHF